MKSAPKSRIRTFALRGMEGSESKTLVQRDHETALRDLKNDSFFQPVNDQDGPYQVELSVEDNRLVFRVANDAGHDLPMLVLSLKPYQRLIKDYFLIVQSYDEAVREGKPSRIEAIDMGRRGLHNEGAELLMERLKDKIQMDMNTARRLFSLICVLHSGKAIIWR
ncbi:MAG: UPF0262 family protein [Rhodospirillales bacterium]|nr:UPF0262 family protein [Alphaproteobacteria bacterium]MCB1838950.1 UPF0262 family protein [Alphaproteobacteria bacterium]MCB9977756.1 UPF0262 family protein [Rhodospirillales bacterium]